MYSPLLNEPPSTPNQTLLPCPDRLYLAILPLLLQMLTVSIKSRLLQITQYFRSIWFFKPNNYIEFVSPICVKSLPSSSHSRIQLYSLSTRISISEPECIDDNCSDLSSSNPVNISLIKCFTPIGRAIGLHNCTIKKPISMVFYVHSICHFLTDFRTYPILRAKRTPSTNADVPLIRFLASSGVFGGSVSFTLAI